MPCPRNDFSLVPALPDMASPLSHIPRLYKAEAFVLHTTIEANQAHKTHAKPFEENVAIPCKQNPSELSMILYPDYINSINSITSVTVMYHFPFDIYILLPCTTSLLISVSSCQQGLWVMPPPVLKGWVILDGQPTYQTSTDVAPFHPLSLWPGRWMRNALIIATSRPYWTPGGVHS